MKTKKEILNLSVNYKSDNYENKARTILNPQMLDSIIDLCIKYNNIDGEIVEVGVWRGSVAIIFGEIFNKKTIHLFDTFEGIPYSNEFDNIHRQGDFGKLDRNPLNYTSFDEVVETLSIYKNINVYKGIFPKETACNIENKKFSIVHLDVDVYQSYKESLEFFYCRMNSGGIIMLDDYLISSCAGATKAINEFCNDKKMNIDKYNEVYYLKF
jgi:hypothetical protein